MEEHLTDSNKRRRIEVPNSAPSVALSLHTSGAR